jgi:hypothetical protein
MSQRQRPIDALKFAHYMTLSLLKDFPEDKVCHQPCPTDNHLVWSVGHLAATYAWMLSLLGRPASVPESYTSYPSLSVAREVMESEYQTFLNAIAELPETQLSQPLAKDAGAFAKDAIELVDRAAWHEGWHSGQISSVRRALGLKGVMG